MSARRLDASTLRRWAHTAVSELISHTDEINLLNVFPVADADTGTNMLFTMRAAWAQADSREAVDDVAAVAAAMADGALRGARGNSGVILSQILRAVADVTGSVAADRDGVLADIDGPVVAAALRHAVTLVVTSMGEAVPGTIVSVLQAAAAAAEDAAGAQADLRDVVGSAAAAAADALERTPSQLAVLAEAGVVDAGGRGLLVLLDALSTTLTGHAPPRRVYEPARTGSAGAAGPVATPQFEVMYLLTGCDAAGVERLRARLDDLGESVAIAASGPGGSDRADRYSVHVHADDAGAAVEAGLAVGSPSNIQITSLHGGRPATGAWSRERAVLALVDGDGAEELFGKEGAQVLRHDPDAPISAHRLLHALVNTGAAQVMVLPNGYVAAEELLAGWAVASEWGIAMVPVPTGSMVQGLAALAVHEPERPLVDDGYTMARAAGGARYASVRAATEEALTWAGSCKPGDGLGIAGDEVVIVGDDLVAAGAGLIDLMLAAGGELVTVLLGADVDPGVGDALAEHVHRQHPGTEFVRFPTGHRGDALLIGVE
ncbi:dihydroxyacetone kinase [Mycolicibacterium duvalii]|uniref:Dihydroxyacetone kinase n=1 Tax=Mycolicibacterium duvalii TaxID=39688 RepID=A0A7I7K0E7_9MYCO|nr:DAK2 domain-containing protein [Mycolicibacterium duvalii]MCV7370123.1 DAK2 domain-containing protein [Mycolicibacterium duvalii]PEG38518.1 dihydroxyacetone kinase [Mycolicibacterium duvalii]BBX17513.1 dihydroxyacetone kinase [Mycolicibacterium duvalii]